VSAPVPIPGLKPYCLITASAGSGKTWRLAGRILQLVLAGEPPDSIVALTFTRKAAAEFFDAVLGRLARAASGPEDAAALCRDLGIPARPPADFLPALRALVRSLHRLQLATIDSFFHRIASGFPFELGLGGAFALLDPYSEEQAKREALAQVLQRGEAGPDARRAFLESFRQATWGVESKQLGRSLRHYLEDYYELYRESGGSRLWAGPGLPDWLRPGGETEDAGKLIEHIDSHLHGAKLKPKQLQTWESSREGLRDWQPHLQLPSPASTVWKNLLGAWEPEKGSCGAFNLGGSKIEPGEALGALLHRLARVWHHRAAASAVRQTRGIADLLESYDEAYDTLVRRRGRLVFGDLPWLLDPRRSGRLDPLALEARLDARFSHWLLDEFQDTSRAQWRVLSNLVDEVLQDPTGRRTFFCVGDIKQSLYGWRGGDHLLFDDLRRQYSPHLAEESLAETRRCSRNVVAWVNQILGNAGCLAGLLPHGGPEWNERWVPHSSARAEAGFACYLEVPQQPVSEDEEGAGDNRHRALLALLRKLDPAGRNLSCAVLVFSNKEARLIADFLRAHTDHPVVLEGEVQIATDNLYGLALLAWAQAVAHPLDRLAEGWLRASPLADWTALPEWRQAEWDRLHAGGFEAAAERIFAQLESHRAPDAFHQQRARALLLAAHQFDLTGSHDPDAFATFLKSKRPRAPEIPGAIQVMTVHKSKGLGFDLVLVTELVRKTRHLNQRRQGPLCGHDAGQQLEWICEPLPSALLRAIPGARAHVENEEASNVYEQLCLLYVAMTRARDALYLIGDDRKSSDSIYLQTLLREALGAKDEAAPEILPGATTWAVRGKADWMSGRASVRAPQAAPSIRPPAGVPAAESAPEPLSPSSAAPPHASFSWDPGRDKAREHGNKVHAILARVERLAPAAAKTLQKEAQKDPINAPAWKEALDCLHSEATQGCFLPEPGAAVWREKAFDVLTSAGRISGIFDRVHLFPGEDGKWQRAILFDFKTEPARDPESQARHHAGQLSLYRTALASLTGLPESAIAINVVFTRPPGLCRL
jgi:ATP-dependent exoDNAse (exonuclease V) beta subunit